MKKIAMDIWGTIIVMEIVLQLVSVMFPKEPPEYIIFTEANKAMEAYYESPMDKNQKGNKNP